MHTADQNPDGSASNMQSEFVFRSRNCLAERLCHAAFCPRPGVISRIRHTSRITGQFRHILLHNSCFDSPCPTLQTARNMPATTQRETRNTSLARADGTTSMIPSAGSSVPKKSNLYTPGLPESTLVTGAGRQHAVDDVRLDCVGEFSQPSPLEQPGTPAWRVPRPRLLDVAWIPRCDLRRHVCCPGCGRLR